MYNVQGFNLFGFNAQPTPQAGVTAVLDDIVFNGQGLQNDIYSVESFSIEQMPSRDFPLVRVPRNHGQIILGDFWADKKIKMSGDIVQSTADLLNTEIDNFKKILKKQRGEILHKRNGVFRRWYGTLINSDSAIDREAHYMVTHAKLNLEFLCDDPFGEDIFDNNDLLSGRTELTLNTILENSGTAESFPTFYFSFVAENAITKVEIINNTNGQSFSVTKAFNVGDLILIDGTNKTCTVNAVTSDYDGQFIQLESGTNSITINLTGTSATWDFSSIWKNKYL